jgi:hypothetical protein
MDRDLSVIIHGLLSEVPELRGNLRKLETAVWKVELENLHVNPELMSLKEFLYFYERGTIHSVESIARIRRLVMQKYPYLRDANYDERKKHSKDYVKEVNKTLFPVVVKKPEPDQEHIDFHEPDNSPRLLDPVEQDLNPFEFNDDWMAY